MFVWSSLGVPHPNSPAGRGTYSTPQGPLSETTDPHGNPHLLLDIGNGRVLEVIGSRREMPYRLPDWIPPDVQRRCWAMPPGVHRIDVAPPAGQLVIWVSVSVFGKEIQAYQEFPDSPAFYAAITQGNAASARLLREVMTQYNRDMRHFVEDLGYSPYDARQELRRINDEIFRMIMESSAEVFTMTSDAVTLGNSIARHSQQMLESAERSGFRAKHYNRQSMPERNSQTAPPEKKPQTVPPEKKPPAPRREEPSRPVDVEQTPLKPKKLPKKLGECDGPNQRHDPCKTRGKDRTKEDNTMIDPDYRDTINGDIDKIRSGRVEKVGETWTVENRTYMRHDNSIHPVGGSEGTVDFNRMQHQLNKQLNDSTKLPTQFMDNLVKNGILTVAQINEVLQLWSKCK